MPRIFNLVSIGVHAIVIAGLVIAQLLAVGPLPIPRQPFTEDTARMVRIADIPLPPVGRRASAPTRVAPNAAPLEALHEIIEETGRENVRSGISASDVTGIENGTEPIDSLGAIEASPPPPVQTPPRTSQPIKLHAGIQAPRKIVDERPVYPSIARSARVEGVVILEAVIDRRGNVESVRVLRSIPLLDQAAVEAVRRWKFTPALLNGDPVAVVMTVTVSFLLQ